MDTKRDSEIRLFLILAIILSILFVFSFISGSISQRKDISVPTEVTSNPFLHLTLEAKAVYVYDTRTKTVLFAKNENSRLPLASLTKLMSAVVALDSAHLDEVITVSKDALSAEGNNGLRVGERWTLGKLLDFSLVTSSNDGMHAIALSLGALPNAGVNPETSVNNFVRAMNGKASDLGLKNTYFFNETGLDNSDVKGGGYSSARDVNAFLEYVLGHYPQMLDLTSEATLTLDSLEYSHVVQNTNTIVSQIPGLLASKTGLTDIAGGNLVIVFDPELGRPFIVSILGSTESGRFEDARVLVSAIMDYIGNSKLKIEN